MFFTQTIVRTFVRRGTRGGAEGAERSVNCKIVPNEVVRGQLRPGAGESGRRDCSGDKGRLSRRPVDLADRLQQVTVSGC